VHRHAGWQDRRRHRVDLTGGLLHNPLASLASWRSIPWLGPRRRGRALGPHAAAKSLESLGNFAEAPDLFACGPDNDARVPAPFAHSRAPLRKVPDSDAMAGGNERRDRGNERMVPLPFERVAAPFAHSRAPLRKVPDNDAMAGGNERRDRANERMVRPPFEMVRVPFAHSRAPFRMVAVPFAHSPASEAHSRDLDARCADNAARSPRNLHRDRAPVRPGSMLWRRKRASDAHSRAPLEQGRP
jgi:hypothetical protein